MSEDSFAGSWLMVCPLLKGRSVPTEAAKPRRGGRGGGSLPEVLGASLGIVSGRAGFQCPSRAPFALSPEERAELEAAIEEGYADFEKGDYVDGIAFAKSLLAEP